MHPHYVHTPHDTKSSTLLASSDNQHSQLMNQETHNVKFYVSQNSRLPVYSENVSDTFLQTQVKRLHGIINVTQVQLVNHVTHC